MPTVNWCLPTISFFVVSLLRLLLWSFRVFCVYKSSDRLHKRCSLSIILSQERLFVEKRRKDEDYQLFCVGNLSLLKDYPKLHVESVLEFRVFCERRGLRRRWWWRLRCEWIMNFKVSFSLQRKNASFTCKCLSSFFLIFSKRITRLFLCQIREDTSDKKWLISLPNLTWNCLLNRTSRRDVFKEDSFFCAVLFSFCF